MATYYEAVGLLAICDAIDSVEGIPFRAGPGEKPFYHPDYAPPSKRPSLEQYPVAPYPPQGLSPPNYAQHPLLAHIPLTVSSPVGSGTLSYAAEQQAAFNTLGPMPGVPGPNMPLPPPATTLLTPPAGPNIALPRPGVGVPLPQPGPPPPPVAAEQPPVSRPAPAPYQAPRPASGASTSTSPAPPSGQEQYKTEECPLCGRAFKGPKASTHKQQHIRRLHPEHYTPKRGGKKRAGA